jgi:hypothetical protein
MSDAERAAAHETAEHFERELREYQRQSAEVAAVLVKDRGNSRAANRAVRISEEYVKLRSAIREGDAGYRFPLVGDEALAPRIDATEKRRIGS